MPVLDARRRPLRDVRVSVTDRCNFRCRYCMPREVFGADFTFLPRTELLSFEEITRVVAACARAGARKVRLTGGEPLLRRDLPRLVSMLAAIPGIEDLALTTNGSLLDRQAEALKAAGLTRITVSLDSLDPATFAALGDTKVPLRTVLAGIEAAGAAGLTPLKVNTVVRRGVNDTEAVALAAYGRQHGLVIRFIEYMDVGSTNGWRSDEVVPSAELAERIGAVFPLEPAETAYAGEVARRWRYADGGGEVGFISSVSSPFCGDCTRARVTAIGEVYTCLFASSGRDVRRVLRSGCSDAELDAFVSGLWSVRDDAYSENRASRSGGARAEMSYLGG
ncbi:MAG: GTP 3',8-cyclase MoaA [Actinomycetota bacterium]|nr:GTP 3',8-cyclase MoaA [Actinomycetota bacterium]